MRYAMDGSPIPETYEEQEALSHVQIPEIVSNGHGAENRPSEEPPKPRRGSPLDPIPEEIRFISPAGLKPRPARWLWEGRIPVGVATLVAGIPGQGKSHICLDLAAKVTRGELEGDFAGQAGAVVVMSSEDMLRETIIPRLLAAGADMHRVFVLPFTDEGFDIEKDLAALERLVEQESGRLVILDPLLAFTAGDGFKEADVRRMLKPAQRLMQEHRLAIVGVMHLNKDVMQDVLSRVTHSQAFTALVRSVLFVGADPDDEDELNPAKVLAHGKSNLGRMAPSMGFRLAETVVPGEDENGSDIGVTTSAVEWLGESDVTAEMLVKGRGSAGTKQAQAETLLRRLCPVHKATALREVEAQGISQSTLERAYRNLGGIPTDPERDPDTGQLQPGIWRLSPPLMKRGE
jgi:archaellum biogenesis ATPase FlaH